MALTRKAVVFFEPDEVLSDDVRPLALEEARGKPVLYWMARKLSGDGATRFFVAAPPRYAADIRDCFPTDAAVTVSDRRDALMDFLSGAEAVAVLPRAALPMPKAGAGFAYAASGDSLRQAWDVRLTNAVPDAALLSGWVPLYGRDTLGELLPIFEPETRP